MKNVLLFVLIMTVCGSLTKPSLGKCTPKIKMMAYRNGKLVKEAAIDWSHEIYPEGTRCWNKGSTHYVLADSIAYTIIN